MSTPNDLLTFLRPRSMPKRLIRVGLALGAALAMLIPNVYAAAFSDNFTTNPGTTANSYDRTLGGVSYTYTFTANGDGGAAGGGLAFGNFGSGGSAAMTLLSSAFNTGTTERVTITRTDLADFTFTSIYIDNPALNENVTVGGYLNNVLVGSTQVFTTGITTMNFGGIHVDEVRITSTDFYGLAIDDFAGDTDPPAVTPTLSSINLSDSALRVGETSTVTFTFSTAVSGFTNADITIPNGSLSAVSSSDGGTTWTATFTPTASVQDPTNVIAVDMTGVSSIATSTPGSGNTNSGNFAIDTLRPTATIVVADASLIAGETSLVTVTFSEAVTGFTNADLTIANGTLSAVSSSDGGTTWTATFTPSVSITDATNVITLANTGVADAAGNAGTGTTDSNNYAIDTARPTASIVVADTALRISETSLVTITFSEAVTGFTNADLTIANGSLNSVSSSDGGVTWTATLTPATSTTDATNVITLNNTGVADLSGNAGTGTTDSNNYAIDTVRPTASIVVADTALAAGETSLVTFTFNEAVAGFTNADLTIANGTLSAVSSSDGGITWTATLTPTASINDATNLITLDNTGVADTAGNAGTGTTDSNNYAIDTARPTATIVVADSNLLAGETSLVTITFSEAVSGFTNADLTVANGTLSAVSSADGGITWTATLTPAASINDATNLITLNNTGVADAAGNTGTGTTDSNNYAIATTRPTASILVADTSLTVGETSLVTITFSEAVTGFTNADLTIANGTLSAVSSSDGGITWTATFTPTASITDATNLITLNNTGVANVNGNTGTGTTDSNNYAIDTARPTANIVVADTALAVGETSTVTITFSEAVTGLTSADFTVANGVLSGLSTGDGGITWTATLTPAASTTDTTNLVTLDNTGVADAAGNSGTGTTNSNNYAIDTLRPTASIVVADTALAAGETSGVTITFNETVTGLTAADFTVANGVLSGLITGDGGITWTATLTPTAGVTDATNLITLDNTGVADAAGNTGTGTTDSNNYAIDNVAPDAPSTPDLAQASDSGSSDTDNITNVTTPTFTGTAEAGSTVELFRGGVTSLGTTTADGSGNWSLTLGTALTDAVYSITARATDAAAQTGPASSALSLTIDTTSAAAPLLTAITNDTGASTTDQITSDNTLIFSGTGAANETVTVFRNAAQIGTATANGSGAWSFDYTATTLAAGTHTFTATTRDLAGNVSPASAAFLVEIDTDTPSAPLIVAISSDTGASTTDGITSDNTLLLAGTADANVTVTISRSGLGVIGTTTANGTGVWSFDYSGTTLPDGAYLFTAFASDIAGNASTVSADFAVTIDTTAPSITTQPTGGTYVAGNSFTLTVAATDTTTLTYQWYLGATLLADYSNRTGSTTASVTHTGMDTISFAGNYTVQSTDLAGNTTASNVATVVVNKADQTITFPVIADRLATAAPFAVSATSDTAFPIAYSVLSGPATISGSTVTVTGTGTVTVRAAQAGDINYNPASVDRTFTVTKATAPVVLGDLAQTYTGSARSATATTTPTGLTVAITYDGGATAPVNAGSYAVVATIDDATYQGSASGTLVIEKAHQTVSFAAVGAITVATPVQLSASASSGLPVTFAVISGDGAISGSSFTANDANAITLRATQSGNGNFHPASTDQPIASADIAKLAQTITFVAPSDQSTDVATFSLSATASSGLEVSFAIQSGPATVSGSTVTLTGAPGTVTLVAAQAGNASYSAAPNVTRTFEVISPTALIYFGSFSGDGGAQGDFGARIGTDGRSGVLIGFLPGAAGGFIVPFNLDENGTFVAAVTPIMSTLAPSASRDAGLAAAPTVWTFHGQLAGGTLGGSIIELDVTFTGAVDPISGPTAPVSGYYTSASLDMVNGAIHSIVGTDGRVYVLAIMPDLATGGSGTLDGATGDFVVVTPSGAAIDGNIDATSTVVDATIIRVDGSTTDFTGIRSDTTRTDRLTNLSSRAFVGTGDNIVVAGFVIGGTEPKSVLLRAVGPGLSQFAITGALSNPRLRLFHGGELLAENDNWAAAPNVDEILTATDRTGAFSLDTGSQDAALLMTLPPGSYTAQVDGRGDVGVALAEIYDASTSPASEYQRLLNISTRGFVGPGDNTLIAGFVITGNAPKRVLVRGVGPALAHFGIAESLAAPHLKVLQGNAVLAQNDDWNSGDNTTAELSAAASATGAFPLNAESRDAALLITLAPGVYTAHVTSADGTTGVALVEVYEMTTN